MVRAAGGAPGKSSAGTRLIRSRPSRPATSTPGSFRGLSAETAGDDESGRPVQDEGEAPAQGRDGEGLHRHDGAEGDADRGDDLARATAQPQEAAGETGQFRTAPKGIPRRRCLRRRIVKAIAGTQKLLVSAADAGQSRPPAPMVLGIKGGAVRALPKVGTPGARGASRPSPIVEKRAGPTPLNQPTMALKIPICGRWRQVRKFPTTAGESVIGRTMIVVRRSFPRNFRLTTPPGQRGGRGNGAGDARRRTQARPEGGGAAAPHRLRGGGGGPGARPSGTRARLGAWGGGPWRDPRRGPVPRVGPAARPGCRCSGRHTRVGHGPGAGGPCLDRAVEAANQRAPYRARPAARDSRQSEAAVRRQARAGMSPQAGSRPRTSVTVPPRAIRSPRPAPGPDPPRPRIVLPGSPRRHRTRRPAKSACNAACRSGVQPSGSVVSAQAGM